MCEVSSCWTAVFIVFVVCILYYFVLNGDAVDKNLSGEGVSHCDHPWGSNACVIVED